MEESLGRLEQPDHLAQLGRPEVGGHPFQAPHSPGHGFEGPDGPPVRQDPRLARRVLADPRQGFQGLLTSGDQRATGSRRGEQGAGHR